MLPRSTSVRIAASGCVYESDVDMSKNKTHFKLSPAELDKLYEVVRKNDFDHIQTRSEQVNDRGGTTITVTYGKTRHQVSNSGMSFVEKSWRKQWHAVLHAIDTATERALEPKRISVAFAFDPALAGQQVEVRMGALPPVRGAVRSGNKKTVLHVRALPGPYTVSIHAEREPSFQSGIDAAAGKVNQVRLQDGALTLGPPASDKAAPDKPAPDKATPDKGE